MCDVRRMRHVVYLCNMFWFAHLNQLCSLNVSVVQESFSYFFFSEWSLQHRLLHLSEVRFCSAQSASFALSPALHLRLLTFSCRYMNTTATVMVLHAGVITFWRGLPHTGRREPSWKFTKPLVACVKTLYQDRWVWAWSHWAAQIADAVKNYSGVLASAVSAISDNKSIFIR